MTRLPPVRRTLRTVLSIAEDAAFDWRYGLDTRTRVASGQLGPVVGDSHAGGRDYHPTRGRHLRKLWRFLDLPPGLGFLDVGCGKGLVLLRASQQSFSRVVGVEYAESMLAVAETNRQRFQAATGRGADIELVHADASDWPVPTDIHVVYLFNPFDETVFAGVMDRVHDSHRAQPRDMWVVVNKARFDDLVCGAGVFSSDAHLHYGSAEFVVYRATA